MQFFQNIVYLIDLGLIEGVVRVFEIAAGIAHRLIEPETIKIITDIVVGGDFLFLVLLREGSVHQFL